MSSAINIEQLVRGALLKAQFDTIKQQVDNPQTEEEYRLREWNRLRLTQTAVALAEIKQHSGSK